MNDALIRCGARVRAEAAAKGLPRDAVRSLTAFTLAVAQGMNPKHAAAATGIPAPADGVLPYRSPSPFLARLATMFAGEPESLVRRIQVFILATKGGMPAAEACQAAGVTEWARRHHAEDRRTATAKRRAPVRIRR